MKKATFLCIAILLVGGSLLWGKSSAKGDSLNLKLMPSLSHKVSIVYTETRNQMLCQDDVTILKSDIHDRGMAAFFLNKAFKIESVLLNGKQIQVKEYKHLKATNFKPRLRLQAAQELKEKGRMMEFQAADFKNLADTIKIQIRYTLNLGDSLKSVTNRPGYVKILGDAFWYPRNVSQDEQVDLTVRTVDGYQVILGGQPVPYDEQQYVMVHHIVFTDSPNHPANLEITRKR